MAKMVAGLAMAASLTTLVLAGSPVIMPYSAAEYNRLPHFNDLPSETPEEALSIQPLGSILKKHGLQDQVGIFLSHRHFDLEEGEKLVARHRAETVHIAPEQNETGAWPYFYQISQDDLGGVLLRPMEFLAKPSEAFKAKHAAVTSAGFLHDYVAALKQHQLLPKFGLFILHREEVVGNRTLETSSGNRSLQVSGADRHPEDPDFEERTVMYTVPGLVQASCGHNRCRHGGCSIL
mmetsp:Transcript_23140/g.53542  ORF Transcript_23140/g.53542 Transcript_23140/m.53542 type:complete len:235 (-) Transcript_23140:391-1095(-)